jgi:fatty-acyl-CoA synthase
MSSDRVSSPTGRSLWDGLLTAAASHRTSLHCWNGDGFTAFPWSEVVRDAERMTLGLRRAGVRPGTTVATVLTNGVSPVRGLLASWMAGAAVASLPVPARGMNVQEYAAQLGKICAQLGAAAFIVEERMIGLIPEEITAVTPALSWESFEGSGRVDPSPPDEDALAFVQYSSGSTSTPKGCMLSPGAIAAQLDMITTMLELTPRADVSVSWLPLSHDMGLFGCLLTCLWADIDDYLSTPERFMVAPGTWFSDMAKVGATVTAGSNTGLHLAARSASRVRQWPNTGLSQVRACIIGAERVEAHTLLTATTSLAPAGLRPEAFMPAYGLAEATLAVTATPLAERPTTLAFDAGALADGELREVDADAPSATVIVGAGVPCAGVDLSALAALPGDRLGEISVVSPSLAMGYLDDRERTAARFVDGGVLTGDLGFVRDGVLYPVGRVDDVISIAGRKVYSREIENAVDALDGVRRGSSTLVAGNDRGAIRLTLLVELGKSTTNYRELADQAATVAMAKAAIALDECVFLPRNSLPKTPSGKTQRHRCQHMLNSGRFTPLATVALAGV